MDANPTDPSPAAGQPDSVSPTGKSASKPLLAWLVILTTASSVTCLLTAVAAPLFSFVILGVLAVGSSTTNEFVIGQIVLWIGTILFVVFLIVGVVGGWLAYRRRRNWLALGLSLIALLPIGLCLVLTVITVLTSSSPLPVDITYHP